MSYKIKTQLPDPHTFTDSFNYHCSGKWFAGIALLMGVLGLAMGNLSNELPQWNTLYLIILCCVYLFVPARIYMKGYYWFFINSWLVGFATVLLFAYVTTLNLFRLELYINNFSIYIYSIILIISILEFFEKRKKIIIYKNIISNSIGNHNFYIQNWLKDLEKSEAYQGMSFALWIGLAIFGVVILVGAIFGSGLMTAKFLLDNGFDIVVELVIGFGMFAFSMVVLSRFIHETLKLIAAYQVKKELTQE
ncbi:hypothetical protein ACTXJO_12325 [Psychrobacter celer]|uniref:hypothetical protein n=1 Tax=Psychrobacter celer TaxID=306572 RepID=UPI003FD2764E